MKLLLLTLLLQVSFLIPYAQKANYAMLEKAERYFDQYNKSPEDNLEKLRLARKETDEIFTAHPDIFWLPKAQLLKGRIYDALNEEKGRLTAQDTKTKNGESLFITATKAYRFAIQVSSTEQEKSRALDYYFDMESTLMVDGGDFFENENYPSAMLYFEEAIALYDILKDNVLCY